MADVEPPTYSDVQAAQRARAELKQNFVTLTNDQLDIQELFRMVAAQLESTPEIGEKHALCEEWNELRQVSTPWFSCIGLVRRAVWDAALSGIGGCTGIRSRTRGFVRIT